MLVIRQRDRQESLETKEEKSNSPFVLICAHFCSREFVCWFSLLTFFFLRSNLADLCKIGHHQDNMAPQQAPPEVEAPSEEVPGPSAPPPRKTIYCAVCCE